MKAYILAIALLGFAVVAHAGDTKSCKESTADKSGCCGHMTMTSTSAKAEGSCPFANEGCCAKAKQTAMKKVAVKHALLSPKAAAL